MPNEAKQDWPRGVGAPAIRALNAAGYTSLDQSAGVPACDLRTLHGMGPRALGVIQDALHARGLALG